MDISQLRSRRRRAADAEALSVAALASAQRDDII